MTKEKIQLTGKKLTLRSTKKSVNHLTAKN